MSRATVAFSLPQKEHGGLHRLVELLRAPLADHGIEAVAVVPARSATAGRMGDVEVVEVPGLRTLADPRRDPAGALGLTLRVGRLAGRAAAALDRPPAIVHVFGFLDPVGPRIARRTGARLVRSVNSSILPERAHPIARRLLARADAGLYEGIPLLLGHAPRGHRAIPFYPASAAPPDGPDTLLDRADLGIDRSSVVVGTWSNITPQKDLLRFVGYAADLAERRPDVHVVVAGRSVPGHEAYLRRVRAAAEADPRLGGRITFLVDAGLDREQAFDLLDVFALTSAFEGVATATVEAMWRRVPVVAHDVGSVGDLVIDGVTGGLVTPGDGAGFVRSVARLLDDDAHRARVVRAAAHRVGALCSTERLTDSFLAAYLPLLDGAGR